MMPIDDCYLSLLGEALINTGCKPPAHVLMDNQVHLLTAPPEIGAVARLMQKPGRGYFGPFRASARKDLESCPRHLFRPCSLTPLVPRSDGHHFRLSVPRMKAATLSCSSASFDGVTYTMWPDS